MAASYLSLAKNCSDHEVVVIMSCNPYTEIGYFETIGRMVECVKQNVAERVLMGITPTYPSEKYGYVVPKGAMSNEPARSPFYRKPTVAVAEELLQQNALWNGGVFAFRLGYMMDIVRKYITSDSFEDTHARYS